MTIVQIHCKIEQYINKNYPISTKNTREHIYNPKINHKENQQKLGTLAQMPKKNIVQSVKKQCLHSLEKKSYHFSPDNKIQLLLGAALSSTSTPQTLRISNYTEKLKQCNWRNISITERYLLLFQKPLFQPKFGVGFENCKEKSELESEETSEKTSTRLVTGTSSQSRNQETHDQEKKLDIREATFRNA
ncbi:hypothetical protein G9A89_019532 [Geosiphon pyriformis]|nr:hypothetical protein G9A89_019532 [Geosiphon pyriformis]